jgi:hypothetical protein
VNERHLGISFRLLACYPRALTCGSYVYIPFPPVASAGIVRGNVEAWGAELPAWCGTTIQPTPVLSANPFALGLIIKIYKVTTHRFLYTYSPSRAANAAPPWVSAPQWTPLLSDVETSSWHAPCSRCVQPRNNTEETTVTRKDPGGAVSLFGSAATCV